MHGVYNGGSASARRGGDGGSSRMLTTAVASMYSGDQIGKQPTKEFSVLYKVKAAKQTVHV